MAKVKFKDAKTGKSMTKKTVDSFVKKHTKPKMKKRGLKYSPINPNNPSRDEAFSEGIRRRKKIRSAKYSQKMAGTKNKKKRDLRKYYNNTYEEGV